MIYMTKEAIDGLKNYKYRSTGLTWIDALHQPFWNGAVELLPRWLAPNLITLVASLSSFAGYIAIMIYAPNFAGEAPSWVYFFNAAMTLVYMHLDCMDGKQARRTGSSSPLGQLFDHGCDALVLYFLVYTTLAAAQVGMSVFSLVAFVAALVVWIAGHWEEYHTGHMVYGNEWYGLTESIYALSAFQFATGLFGTAFWRTSVWKLPVISATYPFFRHLSAFVVLPAMWPSMEEFHLGHLTALLSSLGTIPLVAGNFYRVVVAKAAGRDVPEDERGTKALGTAGALRHLMWFVLLLVEGVVFLNQQLAFDNKWFAQVLLFTFGVAFAMQATRLIVAHMCKIDYVPDKVTPALMALGIVNEMFPLVDARVSVGVIATGVVICYAHYVSITINEICDGLGIRAFVITPKDPAPVKTASVASPVRILTPVKSPAASRPMSPVRGESPDRDEGGEDGQEGEETGDRRGGRSGKRRGVKSPAPRRGRKSAAAT